MNECSPVPEILLQLKICFFGHSPKSNVPERGLLVQRGD